MLPDDIMKYGKNRLNYGTGISFCLSHYEEGSGCFEIRLCNV